MWRRAGGSGLPTHATVDQKLQQCVNFIADAKGELAECSARLRALAQRATAILGWTRACAGGPVSADLVCGGGVSGRSEERARSMLITDGQWGAAPDGLAEHVAQTCALPSVEAAVSFRSQLLAAKAAKVHWRTKKFANAMAWSYDQQGASVLDLAQAYDLPPTTVLRTVLQSHGQKLSNKTVDMLSPRDRASLEEASANDIVASLDQSESAAAADSFENDVEQLIRKLAPDVEIVTENNMRAIPRAPRSKSVITPDLFFPGGLKLRDGQLVRWIEVKNLYGSGSVKFFCRKYVEQAQKYRKRFGPGVFMFSLGFSDELQRLMPSGVKLLAWPQQHYIPTAPDPVSAVDDADDAALASLFGKTL